MHFARVLVYGFSVMVVNQNGSLVTFKIVTQIFTIDRGGLCCSFCPWCNPSVRLDRTLSEKPAEQILVATWLTTASDVCSLLNCVTEAQILNVTLDSDKWNKLLNLEQRSNHNREKLTMTTMMMKTATPDHLTLIDNTSKFMFWLETPDSRK